MMYWFRKESPGFNSWKKGIMIVLNDLRGRLQPVGRSGSSPHLGGLQGCQVEVRLKGIDLPHAHTQKTGAGTIPAPGEYNDE